MRVDPFGITDTREDRGIMAGYALDNPTYRARDW